MAAGERTLLTLDPREERGSRANRRLRREDLVPGVIYGAGSDSISFKVDSRRLRGVLAEGHALFDVEIDGSERLPVIVKDQHRHPVRGQVLHLDLLKVRLDEKIESMVALEIEGIEEAPGVRGGRRARARHARAERERPADRHPRPHRGRRVRAGHRRDDGAVGDQGACRSRVSRRPRRDGRRDHHRADRDRGAGSARGRGRGGRRRGRACRGGRRRGWRGGRPPRVAKRAPRSFFCACFAAGGRALRSISSS